MTDIAVMDLFGVFVGFWCEFGSVGLGLSTPIGPFLMAGPLIKSIFQSGVKTVSMGRHGVFGTTFGNEVWKLKTEVFPLSVWIN